MAYVISHHNVCCRFTSWIWPHTGRVLLHGAEQYTTLVLFVQRNVTCSYGHKMIKPTKRTKN